jgi:hypothetical protein
MPGILNVTNAMYQCVSGIGQNNRPGTWYQDINSRVSSVVTNNEKIQIFSHRKSAVISVQPFFELIHII